MSRPLERLSGAELRAARAEAARQERRAQRLLAKLERANAEFDELRRSYYLAGAGKKLDLREHEDFGPIAREVVAAGRTGMSYDRLYTLWQAVGTAPPGVPAIEIGSYRGGSARLIAEAFLTRGMTPRLYLCDTFAGATEFDPEFDNQDRRDGRWEEASPDETAEYVAVYPAVEVVVGDIVDTSRQLPDSYGLVHVDVNVYATTRFCLRHFAPRLAPGAVMVIDDYGTVTCPGVKQAADEFAADFPEFRVWHLLSAQALLMRRN
jgi:O-methyltransferase